jgi:hypothetical protein
MLLLNEKGIGEVKAGQRGIGLPKRDIVPLIVNSTFWILPASSEAAVILAAIASAADIALNRYVAVPLPVTLPLAATSK